MLAENLLLSSSEALDDLAVLIQDRLFLPQTNASGLTQQRNGENMGGDYYLFETFGIEILLLRNARDSQVEDDSNWKYYLTIDEALPG